MSNVDLKLPLDYRRAVIHMRQQPIYHHIEVMFYDGSEDYALIRTWVTETSEPREHMLHRYQGSIYKRDVDAHFTPGFDVFKNNDKPAVTTRAIRRRPARKVGEVTEFPQATATRALFVERRALQQTLERLEREFIRETTLAKASELTDVRKAQNNIDQRIAFASEAAAILDEEEEDEG